MKIALLTASSGSRGGGEFYFQMLASGLSSLGHSPILLASSGKQMDEFAVTMSEICPVRRFDYTNTYARPTRVLGAVFDRATTKRCQRLLDELDVDIVHLNKQNLEDGLDLLASMASSRHPSVATIHVTRSMVSLGARGGGIRDWLARAALRRTQRALIGTSKVCTVDLARFVGERYGMPIHNVPNGAFPVDTKNRSAVRREWGLSEGDIVLGTLARIELQKNPLFVPKLLRRLPPNVHFVWIGDGSMRQELEDVAGQLGVRQRLHLDGWQAEGRARMSGFDVFALPSLYEGFPFAILEAKSAGLPCVVSNVDGTRDAIDHGVDGFLCRLNDDADWMTTLNNLVSSPDLRLTTGTAGRKRYLSEFSLESMATRTVQVYRSVIDFKVRERGSKAS